MSLLSAALFTPSPGLSPQPGCERATAAWQEEFERARTAGWFHGPLQPLQVHADAPTDASSVLLPAGDRPAGAPPAGAPSMSAGHAVHLVGPLRISMDGRQQRLEGRTVACVPHPAQAAAGASLHSMDALPELAGPAAEGPAAADNAPRFSPAEETAAAIRIHAEAGGDGLSVWLGIDGDAALVATRSAELLGALLRQAREAGQRLAVVVCNGRPMYACPAQHEPIPSLPPGET